GREIAWRAIALSAGAACAGGWFAAALRAGRDAARSLQRHDAYSVMKRVFLGALLFLATLAGTASAEQLVSGRSQDSIQITSTYNGTDIVVFGAIENTDPAFLASKPDIVVILRGPDAYMTVRKKQRVAGIWVNRDSVSMHGMPAFYFLASTRP